MKQVELNATIREDVGNAKVRKSRAQGLVPGVVYGPKVHKFIYVKRIDLEKVVYTPETYLVNLNVDGETYQTVIREVQYHPVHDYIMHVDFYAVPTDVPVTVELPIKLVGLAEGVKRGGKLVPLIRRMKVKGLIKDLPSAVEIDVTHLGLGKSILVRDLPKDKYPFVIRMSDTVAIAKIEIPRALRVKQQQS